jgi:hypothetical protein
MLAAGLLLASARPATAGRGHDFVDEARLFHRIVACGSETEVPDGFDPEVVEDHCKPLRKQIAWFRKKYVHRARPFFAKWRPEDLPRTVVYPFGGGDLVSALTTYPDATEITTISLEHPGDPRRLAKIAPADLAEDLELFSHVGGQLLKWHDSASKNMRKMEKGPIPGQLSLFMLALAVFDYEPVSLKFFKLEPDGSIHYYSKAEIEALDDTQAKKLESRWINTDYSVAFRNMELSFRKRGAGPEDPVITHRHIAWNLDNEHFGESALRKHLEKKGKVAAMTKAASFLLWMNDFKEIRNYLLTHMAWMASDATGPLPKHARAAGFEQITFGKFEEPFLEYAAGKNAEAMRELWETNRKRGLRFRYGYPDAGGHIHLMITRPRGK